MATRPGMALATRAAELRADYTVLAVDTVLIVVAYVVTLAAIRLPPSAHRTAVELFAIIFALAAHLVANAAWGLYGRIWRYAGIDEARRLLGAGLSVAAFLAILFAFGLARQRPGLIVAGPVAAIALMGLMRFHSRLFAWQRHSDTDSRLRVAVVGAGDTGASIIRDMRRESACGMHPVVVADDDERKQGLSILGLRVAGRVEDLPRLVNEYGVNQILLAVSSPASELIERASAAATAADVPLKILPGLRELVRGLAPMRQIREVRIEDLLGRDEVSTDLRAVAGLVAGRRVLVTGAGGSIGSEIARQLSWLGPERLFLLDHDETLLYDVGTQLNGSVEEVLADIRDGAGIRELFERLRPEVVLHAAAHKHVPILERFPLEAIRTNVFGTLNVVRAATDVGVKRFVYISTDKAVNPASVLGATKWLGEQLVLNFATTRRGYCCVRFGNVLGSRGSVVPTFRRQILAGGPVTVTDEKMTRFFMSVEEAVQLVLQAAVFTEDRDTFMLEMGRPVRILDLAQRMVRLTVGDDAAQVPIEFTGARPGEKSEEQLSLPGDTVLATPHPSISRLLTSELPRATLEAGLTELTALVGDRHAEQAAKLLFGLASRSGPAGSRGAQIASAPATTVEIGSGATATDPAAG